MSREEKLAEFVGWAQQHITRDAKGQAQIFLDHLFQAFGHPGVAVAEAGQGVRRVRTEALAEMKGGLRALNRTLELPGANPLKDAHAAPDAAVLAAYGFSAKKDLLAQLLDLNVAVAQRIEKGELVTPPSIPASFPQPETLISEDCIRPSTPAYSRTNVPSSRYRGMRE